MSATIIITIIMLVAGILCMKKRACPHCGEQANTLSNKTVGTLLIVYSLLLILSEFFLYEEIAKGEFIWIAIGLFYLLKKDGDQCLACKLSIR